MNCIYCNITPTTIRNKNKIIEYKCNLCQTDYIVDANVDEHEIMLLTIYWLVDGKEYQAQIWPFYKYMDIILDMKVICEFLPLEWVFPNTLPNFIKKIHGLRIFL